MKQTDKCESLKEDNTCHFDFEKCQHIGNWKSCTRYNKSHSQKLLSTKQSDVRASEEEVSKPKINPYESSGSSESSSGVVHNPLTKDDIKLSDEYGNIIVEWRLMSALNGLRKDDIIVFEEMKDLVSKILNSDDYLEFRKLVLKLINNKKKWFPIIDEVQKE